MGLTRRDVNSRTDRKSRGWSRRSGIAREDLGQVGKSQGIEPVRFVAVIELGQTCGEPNGRSELDTASRSWSVRFGEVGRNGDGRQGMACRRGLWGGVTRMTEIGAGRHVAANRL